MFKSVFRRTPNRIFNNLRLTGRISVSLHYRIRTYSNKMGDKEYSDFLNRNDNFDEYLEEQTVNPNIDSTSILGVKELNWLLPILQQSNNSIKFNKLESKVKGILFESESDFNLQPFEFQLQDDIPSNTLLAFKLGLQNVTSKSEDFWSTLKLKNLSVTQFFKRCRIDEEVTTEAEFKNGLLESLKSVDSEAELYVLKVDEDDVIHPYNYYFLTSNKVDKDGSQTFFGVLGVEVQT